MYTMRAMWRNAKFGVLATLALLAAGGVFALLACNERASPPAQPQSAADRFYLGGRADFRICVDAAGQASEAAAREDLVRRALSSALAQVDEVPLVYTNPIIAHGCPEPRVLSLALRGERLDYLDRHTSRDRSQFVGDDQGPDSPSLYRVFVYIVDPETYAHAFGSEPYVSTAEEFVCEGICGPVTSALYIREGGSSDALRNGLLEVLGLLAKQQVEDLLGRRQGAHGPSAALNASRCAPTLPTLFASVTVPPP